MILFSIKKKPIIITFSPTFDSIALGGYAYSYFGYWIFPFTLGSQDVVNFRDSGLSGPSEGDYVAVDKDVSSYNTIYIINEDGTALDGTRLGTNGWSYQYNYDLDLNRKV